MINASKAQADKECVDAATQKKAAEAKMAKASKDLEAASSQGNSTTSASD